MLLIALLLQTAPPDIAINIDAQIRRVRIAPGAEARLEVRAEPDAGSAVAAEVTPPAEGRRELRNVRVRVRGEARIAEPSRGRQPDRRTE